MTHAIYTLLEQIGEGGMGIVFRSEQSQPFQRLVALKFIKPGRDSRHVIARFAHLARLGIHRSRAPNGSKDTRNPSAHSLRTGPRLFYCTADGKENHDGSQNPTRLVFVSQRHIAPIAFAAA
jgi:serine/threonine protein kinase